MANTALLRLGGSAGQVYATISEWIVDARAAIFPCQRPIIQCAPCVCVKYRNGTHN